MTKPSKSKSYHLALTSSVNEIQKHGIRFPYRDILCSDDSSGITLFSSVHAIEDSIFNGALAEGDLDHSFSDLTVLVIDISNLDVDLPHPSKFCTGISIPPDRIIGSFRESDISDYLTIERNCGMESIFLPRF